MTEKTITCSSGNSFKITGENKLGEIITVEALPKVGYRFISWSDGNTDNPRYIEILECGIHYMAIFEEIDEPPSETVLVTLNYIDINNNNIIEQKSVSVLYNSSYEIDTSLNNNCYKHIDCINHQTNTQIIGCNIPNLTNDIEIDVRYELQPLHNITVNTYVGDKVDTATLEEIPNVVIKITPTENTCNSGKIEIINTNNCYKYLGLYDGNNKKITDKTQYTYENITDDINYKAFFTLQTHTVTINPATDETGGKIDSNNIKINYRIS